MTKSRQSVTKLRLSRIIRCLLALGCLKLCLLGFAAFNIQWPFFNNDAEIKKDISVENVQEIKEPFLPDNGQKMALSQEVEIPAQTPEISQPLRQLQAEELPTGIKAAELAAAAKPQRKNLYGVTSMPTPLLTAEPFNPLNEDGSFLQGSLLPEPEPLGQPLAEAGVILPEQQERQAPVNDSLWDMAELKSLPFPGLGSAQVAQAASLDMPVPPKAPVQSPFSPAEQIKPLEAGGRVLPGAPAFPQNIPSGVNNAGSALPFREPTLGQTGSYTPPVEQIPLRQAPAPNITHSPSNLTNNMKTQELARQQQDILVLRQQMDQRLKDLQTAEDKMKSMLKDARDVEDQKVKTLIQMYANMKPRTAAQALENMDERIAVRILAGMAPKQSGEILTYTNPVKTAKFTEMMTRLRMGE